MTGGPRELGPQWRATVADDHARRVALDVDGDDTAWETVAVPGHWRSAPAFAHEDGPLLYRHRFEVGGDERRAGDRWWIVLEGAFVSTDVWLDGTYLGDTEGYFAPHAFEVTEAVSARRAHVLAVEVACAPEADRTRKRHLTGAFGHGLERDQSDNPGGLWRPVRLARTGPVRITRRRILCREADEAAAVVAVAATLDSPSPRPVEVVTRVVPLDDPSLGVEHRQQPHLAAGENRLEWDVTVPDPALWWPWSLGDQPRYAVSITVLVGGDADSGRSQDDGPAWVEAPADLGSEGSAPSDHVEVRTGLRRVHVRHWTWSVNGERLFLKGSVQGPSALRLAEATDDDLRRDVGLAIDTGLDLLRLQAHVSRPALYDAADRAGLLLWQDLPLRWGYARGVKTNARRQAAEAVDLLGHHPSILTWCAHDEPFAVDVTPEAVDDPAGRRRLGRRWAIRTALPSWNRSVLDRAVTKVLEHDDGTRPVVPHAGVLPHPPQLAGTDAPLWFGWYVGQYRDLERVLARWPRLGRFVTGFGAQAVPDEAAFLDPGRWPDLDWEAARDHHGLQRGLLDRFVPVADADDLAAWAAATQAYQAEVVRHGVEVLRRLKYRPTGGFAHVGFAAGGPAVGFCVLDHQRRPTAAWAALRDACRPVLPVAAWPPDHLHPGQPVAADLHVVNDRRIALTDMVMTAHLSWASPDGEEHAHVQRWQGDVAADTCTWVGTLHGTAPHDAAAVVLDLQLRGADVDVANRYVVPVATGHHQH